MTWVPGRKRWTKFYKGKMWAVSCRQLRYRPGDQGRKPLRRQQMVGEERAGDRQAARETGAEAVRAGLTIRRRMASWFKRHLKGSPIHRQGLEEQEKAIRRLENILQTEAVLPPLDFYDEPLVGISSEGKAVWSERFQEMEEGEESAPTDRTTGYWGDKWIDRKRALARAARLPRPARFLQVCDGLLSQVVRARASRR